MFIETTFKNSLSSAKYDLRKDCSLSQVMAFTSYFVKSNTWAVCFWEYKYRTELAVKCFLVLNDQTYKLNVVYHIQDGQMIVMGKIWSNNSKQLPFFHLNIYLFETWKTNNLPLLLNARKRLKTIAEYWAIPFFLGITISICSFTLELLIHLLYIHNDLFGVSDLVPNVKNTFAIDRHHLMSYQFLITR